MAFTTEADVNVLQQSDADVVDAGQGNDTYIVSEATLGANQTVTLTDGQGSNSIQLVDGLGIQSSTVAQNSLQLTLTNGAVVNVNEAASFTYEPRGNVTAGIDAPDQAFSSFVTETLGLDAVPATGTVAGGPVTIGGPSVLQDTNLSVTLTETTPPLTIPDGAVAGVTDAPGPQTLNVANGGSIEMIDQSGTNDINIEADAATFDVALTANLDVILSGPDQQQIVLEAPTEPQALVFGDGATTLQFNQNDEVVLGDQVIGDSETFGTDVEVASAIVDDTTTSDAVFNGASATAARTASFQTHAGLRTVDVTGVDSTPTASEPMANDALAMG